MDSEVGLREARHSEGDVEPFSLADARLGLSMWAGSFAEPGDMDRFEEYHQRIDQLSTQELLERVKKTLEGIYTYKEDFTYVTPLMASGEGALEPRVFRNSILESGAATDTDVLFDLVHVNFFPQAIACLSEVKDEEEMRTILGMFVDRSGLPKFTDKIRDLRMDEERMKYFSIDEEGLDRIGRLLIGEDKTFFTNLNDLYAQVDFAHYPSNEASTVREMRLLVDVIKNSGIVRPVVAEIGCGTGRIPNELAEAFSEDETGDIIGIDPSPKNLRDAQQSDKTGRVRYLEGKFEPGTNLPLLDASVDIGIVLGRTLTHMRDFSEFENAFSSLYPKMTKKGFVIFDLPDPNTGDYERNRKNYARILQSLRIPVSTEDAMRYFNRVVDSPDKGKSLYDRYVLDLDLVGEDGVSLRDVIAKRCGFSVSEISRAEIPDWGGAENIYYKAEKISDDVAEYDQEITGDIDPAEITSDQLMKMPPDQYEKFLGRMVFKRPYDQETLSRLLPTIVKKTEKDLDVSVAELQSDDKRRIVVDRISQWTRFVMSRVDFSVDSEVLHELYSLIHDSNPIVSRYGRGVLPDVLRIDNLRERESVAASFDVRGRYYRDLREAILHLDDPENIRLVGDMVDAGWSEGYGNIPQTFLEVLADLESDRDPELILDGLGYVLGLEKKYGDEVLAFLESHKEVNDRYGDVIRQKVEKKRRLFESS